MKGSQFKIQGFTSNIYSGPLALNLPLKTKHFANLEPSAPKNPADLFSHLPLPASGTVAIVVSDKTRLCDYPLCLPLLTFALMKSGIKKNNIVFFIAYGTHARQTDAECLAAYGRTYNTFRFIHHDARDPSGLTTLSKTSFGTDITIRKDILDYDHIISFGAILHHYFAGFGGGRKLFFPGLAGYDAILQNHKLFLNFNNRSLHPLCRSGNLDTNPVALDLEEINHRLPERLEIHAILNTKGKICEIITGKSYDEFRQACKRYDTFYRSEEAGAFDLVIASAGGYPKDINLIQSHKAIHNAASFVRDGGQLILFAECRDGIGNSRFPELFRLGGFTGIFDAMEKHYENNGVTALSLISKTNRICIHMVTSLNPETCSLMNLTKISPGQAQEIINNETGKIAVIENASMIYR